MATAARSDVRLDDTDKAIIRLLQEDGRMSYTDLSTEVGLSPAAVRQRVLHLIEERVMQVIAVTDPTRLGFDAQAMVGVRIEGDLEIPVEHLSKMSEVEYLVVTTGRFDLLADILCEDSHHLLQVINRIRQVQGVVTTEIFTYLDLRKQTYDWGVL
ncbi:MAG: Lrp/AsnC family transcriptional regulator [Haloechinothrix sp.]